MELSAPISDLTSVPVLKSTLPLLSSTKNLSVSVPALSIEESCKVAPVIELLTFNEFSVASEPLTISFFQFGILIYIMVGYSKSPLPVKADNSLIINRS